MGTCMVVRHTPWWMRLTPPTFRPPPRREHSSPMTTHGRIPSYAWAAGGVTSTADDLATWMRALVGGKVFGPEYQRQWIASPAPVDPRNPEGQKYGYGISLITFGPNKMYFHGGEMPGYNSFMGYDPVNDVTLIVWTSLTVSVDGRSPANTLMLRLLDLIYTVSTASVAAVTHGF